MVKEIKQNLNRITGYNPHTARTVDNVNPLNTFRKQFNANNSTAALDIDIKEMPVPCTVSPPRADSWCETNWTGEYFSESTCTAGECCGGYLSAWTGSITGGTGDYTISGSGITVPYDGCYFLHFKSSAWGLSYFDTATMKANVTHNGTVVTSGANRSTGFIAILGPWIYYWPGVSNLFAVVEARAGDTIGCNLEASNFRACYGWVAGTYLRGLFIGGTNTLSVRLVAAAENVKAVPPEIPLEYPEGTVVDPVAALVSGINAPSNARVIIV